MLFAVLALALSIAKAAAGNPYTFAIVVDETPESRQRASQFIKFMSSKEPFWRMGNQVAFKIVPVSTEKLNCSNRSETSKRIILCDKAYAAAAGANVGAHRTMIFTSKGSGGGGGSVPVASLDYPLPTMLHELLHSYNFGDEYPYKAPSELDRFCTKDLQFRNLAIFEPRQSFFLSSQQAHQVHNPDIPWAGDIEAKTEIIYGGQLGTMPGVYPADTTGLFHANNCDARKMSTWKPLEQATVMGSNTAEPPIPWLYSKWVVGAMSAARGEQIYLTTPPLTFESLAAQQDDESEAPKKSGVVEIAPVTIVGTPEKKKAK